MILVLELLLYNNLCSRNSLTKANLSLFKKNVYKKVNLLCIAGFILKNDPGTRKIIN